MVLLLRRAAGARGAPARGSRCSRGCSRTSRGRSCPGAEAPKCSIETLAPSATHLCQPSETPASTASRASTSGGSTESRYSDGLLLEELPAGQRDDPGRDVFAPRGACPPRRRRDLGSGGDQDQVGTAPVHGLGLPDHVARRARRPRPPRARAPGTFWRRQEDRDRALGALERDLHAIDGLVRVGGADHPQVRDRPKRHVVLDRLVRRAVLAEADRVVRPDPDDGKAHERREPHGRTHVVAEDKEGRAVRLHDPAVNARARSRSSPCRARGRRTGCSGPRSSAEKMPAPSKAVFVDSTRSAAPPSIVGT